MSLKIEHRDPFSTLYEFLQKQQPGQLTVYNRTTIRDEEGNLQIESACPKKSLRKDANITLS